MIEKIELACGFIVGIWLASLITYAVTKLIKKF